MKRKIKIPDGVLTKLFIETTEETGINIKELLRDNINQYQWVLNNMMRGFIIGGYDITLERLDKVFRAFIEKDTVDGSNLELWDKPTD